MNMIGDILRLKVHDIDEHFQAEIHSIDGINDTITVSIFDDKLRIYNRMATFYSNEILSMELVKEKENSETAPADAYPPLTYNAVPLTYDAHAPINYNAEVDNGKTGVKVPPCNQVNSESFPIYKQQNNSNKVTPSKAKGKSRQSNRANKQNDDVLLRDDFTVDYDFQEQLKHFEKLRVTEENPVEQRTPKKNSRYQPEPQYRHDQMVIKHDPVVYRQIVLRPLHEQNNPAVEYYTDNGLVIPCISAQTRNSISELAHIEGYTYSRQIEAFAINSSQMVLSVLGGPNRFSPRNFHQLPHVVILTGDHMVGTRGLSLARCLADQNLHVTVLTKANTTGLDIYHEEHQLLALTTCKIVTNPSDLPKDTPVDLIVTAIDQPRVCGRSNVVDMWSSQVIRWCNKNKYVPNLSVSPSHSDSHLTSSIKIKWSICTTLPTPTANGSNIYLVDSGYPRKVFQKALIKYMSPFCNKPFLALHSGSGDDDDEHPESKVE